MAERSMNRTLIAAAVTLLTGLATLSGCGVETAVEHHPKCSHHRYEKLHQTGTPPIYGKC